MTEAETWYSSSSGSS